MSRKERQAFIPYEEWNLKKTRKYADWHFPDLPSSFKNVDVRDLNNDELKFLLKIVQRKSGWYASQFHNLKKTVGIYQSKEDFHTKLKELKTEQKKQFQQRWLLLEKEQQIREDLKNYGGGLKAVSDILKNEIERRKLAAQAVQEVSFKSAESIKAKINPTILNKVKDPTISPYFKKVKLRDDIFNFKNFSYEQLEYLQEILLGMESQKYQKRFNISEEERTKIKEMYVVNSEFLTTLNHQMDRNLRKCFRFPGGTVTLNYNLDDGFLTTDIQFQDESNFLNIIPLDLKIFLLASETDKILFVNKIFDLIELEIKSSLEVHPRRIQNYIYAKVCLLRASSVKDLLSFIKIDPDLKNRMLLYDFSEFESFNKKNSKYKKYDSKGLLKNTEQKVNEAYKSIFLKTDVLEARFSFLENRLHYQLALYLARQKKHQYTGINIKFFRRTCCSAYEKSKALGLMIQDIKQIITALKNKSEIPFIYFSKYGEAAEDGMLKTLRNEFKELHGMATHNNQDKYASNNKEVITRNIPSLSIRQATSLRDNTQDDNISQCSKLTSSEAHLSIK